MVQKRQLYLIFIPAILIVLAIFSFRLYQYITIFISPLAQTQTDPTKPFIIPLSSYDTVLGNKKAPKTIIAFEDVQCAHCAELYTLAKELETAHPNTVKIIWKPASIISIPFSSETAHKYLLCAKEQNTFIPYLELLFSNQTQLSQDSLDLFATETKLNQTKLQTCLAKTEIQSYLSETKQLTEFLQIQSVPALFIDNRQIPIPNTLEDFETLLDIPTSSL